MLLDTLTCLTKQLIRNEDGRSWAARAQRQYNELLEADWRPLREGSCFQLVPAILYFYTCTALQDMGAAYACS